MSLRAGAVSDRKGFREGCQHRTAGFTMTGLGPSAEGEERVSTDEFKASVNTRQPQPSQRHLLYVDFNLHYGKINTYSSGQYMSTCSSMYLSPSFNESRLMAIVIPPYRVSPLAIQITAGSSFPFGVWFGNYSPHGPAVMGRGDLG